MNHPRPTECGMVVNHPTPRVILLAVCALAATAARADDRTYTFACDTHAGHYSSWSMTTQAPALVITGTLRLNEMIADKKWSTVANVFIRGGADGKLVYGFHAYDVDRLQKTLHLELLKPGGHEDFGNDSMKKGQKPVRFRLELTATGTLRANVGGAEKSTELGSFTPQKIELGCSTGDFSFADVRIEEVQR
jgi:hypothetical protein